MEAEETKSPTLITRTWGTRQANDDPDVLAQNVVNAWCVNVRAGKGELLAPPCKDLFEKTCAYRAAKQTADNWREHIMLTDEETTEEERTKREFLEAYRSFDPVPWWRDQSPTRLII